MPKRLNGAVLREFRTLFHLGVVGDLTDGQLLERFSNANRETAELAFAALVERHAPMVLNVCQAILQNEHDAQDAFQSTFLVLARKARALWVRDSIAPWLHQVAYRAARQARTARHRRLAKEQEAAAKAPTSEPNHETQPERSAILHEEIERLPARYRGPLVLCDLKGQTQEQAARQLACPVGTIKSRLNRGRQRLKDRLKRRGLAPAFGIGATLATDATQAAVPFSLVQSTIVHAISFSASRGAAGVVPVAVASLTEGVLRAMMFTKIKMLMIPGLLLTTAIGAGVVAQVVESESDPKGNQKPPQAEQPKVADEQVGEPGVILVERGTIEAQKSTNVINQTDLQTSILSILPEGTLVEKDQLVCELDTQELRNELANQRLATEQARADYQNAQKTFEIKEIDVEEYIGGILPQELKTIEGQIKLAQAELELAKDRLQVIKESEEKGQLLDLKIKQGEFAILKTEFNLQQIEQKREVLKMYTGPKQVKTLQAEVESARAILFAREAAMVREMEREEEIQSRIEKCKIYAPADGMVTYASADIREGAIVRPRQILFRLNDIEAPLQLDTRVPEAMIDKITPGKNVLITVDAFPNQTLKGVVASISPLPNPTRLNAGLPEEYFYNTYNTKVTIEENTKHLRPGMTATVEILAEAD